MTVYGSTATKMGLKSSDLNIDLSSETPAAHLAEIYLILKEDESGKYAEYFFSYNVHSVEDHTILCRDFL